MKPLDIVTTAGATADIAGVMNTLPGTQTVAEDHRTFNFAFYPLRQTK